MQMKKKKLHPSLLAQMTRTNKIVDEINHPKHYTSGKIQPVEYIDANDLGYYEGNVLKYITRWKLKDGLKDLKKAQYYLNRLIKLQNKI